MFLPSIRRLYFSVLRHLLLIWVRSETIDNSVFHNLRSDLPLVYVLQQPSISDLIVLDNECRKAGLHRPVERFNEPSLEHLSCFFYLRQEPNWTGRKSKQHIAPTLKQLVCAVDAGHLKNVQVVPISVYWGQSPDRETSPWKLIFADSWAVTGRLRRFFQVLILGHKTRVQFSAPLQLSELTDQGKGQVRTQRMLHRLLRVHFRNSKAAVIGPDLSHRRTLVKALIHEPEVQKNITLTADREGISLEKAQKRALKYANEIASDYSYIAIRFLELVLSWFWNKFYDGIKVNHIEGVREVAHGHEVIYVPCHRSHIDYLLMSYLLFTNGLTPPHIAAGINLNMPIIGRLLRRGGAFFMRRTFRGNPLYTSVFNEYMHTLFNKGFPVEYFIEGGRSRTGRTLQPKTGMLALTLSSFLRSQRLPIVFVPVYIGYERVLEGRTYLGELRGANKKKESFFDVFRVIAAIRKQRFGKVAVNFGQPLKLADFLNAQHHNWQHIPLEERKTFTGPAAQQLATHIARYINAAADINPVNLVALAMLSTQRLALDENALTRIINLYLSLLRSVPYSKHTSVTEGDGLSIITHVHQMKLISEQQDALGRIYYLDENNAVLMTYYRNNVLHVFALPALLASFFHSNARMTREHILELTHALYPYLQAELFTHYAADEIESVVDQWLTCFIEHGLLQRDGETYQRPAPSSTQYVLLSLLARTLIQTLQRFYMAIALLLNKGQNALDAQQLEELCTVMAQRLSILHGLNAPEFFDKSLFRHFIQTLINEGVIQTDDEGKLSYHDRLGTLAESAAKRVLPAEIRLSIRQVTTTDDAPASSKPD
ncbi:glycerol-3-phosphate 1-O-acyltransferase PlsB [Denitrificimonas sp. JX-1]|uniref:Glycerol-3-phosphate acyltransferase n=1 Tax=Denitrificimonas halotolerans TaxID=3098930 RepID=A0ABU5GQ20_9GAMM|nr:glycerol-3-phosphate 1-O-acyltransferase PlsB [Denitrificimonas sp. JX-1]MDY7218667.1 glycerol-3-phosphate 1-O-acyltransferase PlsB [Denitrificimonas sp. JX-1]